LHTQGTNTFEDWGGGVTNKYGTNVIEQINDPNGDTAAREITSIPSPFARMDLVKTAFKKVVDLGLGQTLDGDTIYHKMVSDCLDVGQIFFEFNIHRRRFEILVWDRTMDLQQLLNSHHPGHRQLGKTYEIFLNQDKETYNFDRMDRLFLLNDKGGRGKINIIGATSPATLFFSSANDLSYMSKHIFFGNRGAFAPGQYAPLYIRDRNYQLYWYFLQRSIPNFATLFPEVNAYLDMNFNFIPAIEDRQSFITTPIATLDTLYDNIAAGNAGNPVTVLGHNLRQRRPDVQNIEENSGFVIQSPRKIRNVSPLVLPVDRYTPRVQYVHAPWDRNTTAPYKDLRALEERTLPAAGDSYPYLTISDFLEDTIVRLPYEINRDSFFDGNFDRAKGKSYLLPLTDRFFDFFTEKQLRGNMPDGKKMIELESNAGGVKVTLRIPIRENRYIEYGRLYFEHNDPDISINRGAIKDDNFVFALFPNIRFQRDVDAYYRFGLIHEAFGVVQNYEVEYVCAKSDEVEYVSANVIRNNLNRNFKQCKNFILEKSNFNYIRIKCANGCSGVVVPVFHMQGGTDRYTFAIDFGTTNMHIEYSLNKHPSQPFNIGNGDKQLHLLSQSSNIDDTVNYIYDFDFIPETIGGQSEFQFPMRTALCEATITNWQTQGAFPLGHANVAFPYEKRIVAEYNRILTGLKWSNDENNAKKIQCYIESLFLILRNKVILNHGDLRATRIVWFYPISMTRHRFNMFKDAWMAAYRKYFGYEHNDGNEHEEGNVLQNIIPVTESIAPYIYYRGVAGNAARMVSIDIGGGTSDIVIAEGENVRCITSFRFAANSIFGDGYANGNNNGIVRKFKTTFEEVMREEGLADLQAIYERINGEMISSNIASFLFSLKDNKKIIERGLQGNVDFNRMLQNDGQYKIIFIFFYAAIIYHLAHIMKAKNLGMPRHITFSGNGSKVVRILTTDTRLLERYTKLIFEKIYGTAYARDGLTILQNPNNPKEVTCKGGISVTEAQDYGQIADTKVVLKSSDNQSFVAGETYGDIEQHRKKYLLQTVEEVKIFNRFVIDLNREFSYSNNFGMDNASLAIAEDVCFRDLKTFADNGLAQKRREVDDGDIKEETFFFYPLNGMLPALSGEIYNRNKQ
jgi:hypothetical protein